MTLPRLIITGASGFIGRHVLDGLKKDFHITAMARRSQLRCGAPIHKNISWLQVDIRHADLVSEAFKRVRNQGGADYVLHLAAHYDFTGEEHPDYERTNIKGLRFVLDECRTLNLKMFIFASSIAACNYPRQGSVLNESSPPDGAHIYARSQARGEEMLADFDDSIPSCITRFAALFSDWCEYPPLYFFLETWLTKVWNRRILGGHGHTAIPYLHIREMAPFFRAVIRKKDILQQREVLLASPDTTMSHRELFKLTHLHDGERSPRPLHIPKTLCRVGIPGRDILGRILGDRPFERPWMASHIDKDLLANPHRTWERLDWRPRGRLLICRRLPFLLEHRKTDAVEWNHRNEAAMKAPWVRPNLVIHKLLEYHMEEIRQQVLSQVIQAGKFDGLEHYRAISEEVLDWRVTIVYRHFLNAIRTNEKGIFTDYCKDLASRRHGEGIPAEQVCRAIRLIRANIMSVIETDPRAQPLMAKIRDILDTTVDFGCDRILETYEELGAEVPDDGGCEDPFMKVGQLLGEPEKPQEP
ncbi:MAG: NAD(P)-dependent oxidoreductase [Thermoanaerobaculales bacterium]|nr:NAD(P)-dependent oxidoreductase [Thermoanaerobaculales bacterium]